MSSNIRINRICEYCGHEFEAKTIVTRFCSTKCNGRAAKLKIKHLKMRISEQQTRVKKTFDTTELNTKEFLKVKDAARLLNSSKDMIYSLIRSGRIRGVNLGINRYMAFFIWYCMYLSSGVSEKKKE